MNALSETISRWLAARSTRQNSVVLTQRNIYIFPASAGFAFLLLLVLMLITAINYQNSLIYLFTFFLSAVFFVSIWLCFLNLSGLTIASHEAANHFEGEPCSAHVHLKAAARPALALKLGADKHTLVEAGLNSGESVTVTVPIPPLKRGVHTLERLRVESRFPFGFIVAWTWLKLNSNTIVYPRPLQGVRHAEGKGSKVHNTRKLESDDLTELKAYREGDPLSRIDWKHYAAKDQLVIRSSAHGGQNTEWLKWFEYESPDQESRLSHLCFDILDLNTKQQAYGLDIPGVLIKPSIGEAHKHKCLKALAMFNASAFQQDKQPRNEPDTNWQSSTV